MSKATLPISMAFAPSPTQSYYEEIQVPVGSTLLQALQQAGWLQRFADLKNWCEQHVDDDKINNRQWYVGVFSQKKLLSYELKAHDRIEVYRPLTIDPMHKRKTRATNQ